MQAIQVTQRPHIAQHPFCFLPAVTLQLSDRLVELLLVLLSCV